MDMSAFKLCIPAPIKTIWTCQHSNYAYPPLLKQYGHVSIQIMHTRPDLKQYGHVSIQIMHTRPY